MGKKLGEKVGEKTGEKAGESLGEIHKLSLCLRIYLGRPSIKQTGWRTLK